MDTISDLVNWVRRNVLDFNDDNMFETLLGEDVLFSNPGLSENQHAQDFVREIMAPRHADCKGNSFEFGFKVFVRSVIQDVFKDKARGLVLRNFEIATARGCTRELRSKVGRFLDEILRAATTNRNSAGNETIEIGRRQLEVIKENHVSFFTDFKDGTYPIEVYMKDVFVPKYKWLVELLEHNSFCWETITMMRRKGRIDRYVRLQDFFESNAVNDYQLGVILINKLLRDATMVKPGRISHDLVTPFNSNWRWNDTTFIIEPIETWHEDNVMSEIAMPVSVGTMITLLMDALK